jgi:hypothetical protein
MSHREFTGSPASASVRQSAITGAPISRLLGRRRRGAGRGSGIPVLPREAAEGVHDRCLSAERCRLRSPLLRRSSRGGQEGAGGLVLVSLRVVGGGQTSAGPSARRLDRCEEPLHLSAGAEANPPVVCLSGIPQALRLVLHPRPAQNGSLWVSGYRVAKRLAVVVPQSLTQHAASTRCGEERNQSTRVWGRMRTGSPAPTSRTWSRPEGGRSSDGSDVERGDRRVDQLGHFHCDQSLRCSHGCTC